MFEKFIELTSAYTDEEVMIATDDISSFMKTRVSERSCTKVFLKNGTAYTVYESYGEIMRKMKGNQ